MGLEDRWRGVAARVRLRADRGCSRLRSFPCTGCCLNSHLPQAGRVVPGASRKDAQCSIHGDSVHLRAWYGLRREQQSPPPPRCHGTKNGSHRLAVTQKALPRHVHYRGTGLLRSSFAAVGARGSIFKDVVRSIIIVTLRLFSVVVKIGNHLTIVLVDEDLHRGGGKPDPRLQRKDARTTGI